MHTVYPIGAVVVVVQVQPAPQVRQAEMVVLDYNLVSLGPQYIMQAEVVVVHISVPPAQADRVVAVPDPMATLEHQEQSTPVVAVAAQDIRV